MAGDCLPEGAFLCAQSGVSLDTVFTKRFSSGFFGGEGFILQQLGGMGTAFLEVDGSRVEKTLAPGEVLRVDTGNVVAFESTVSYEIETVRGGMNIFLGGEGLFLTRLVGPGRVILQTQILRSSAAASARTCRPAETTDAARKAGAKNERQKEPAQRVPGSSFFALRFYMEFYRARRRFRLAENGRRTAFRNARTQTLKRKRTMSPSCIT